jgi:hypothetical protein
MTGYNEQKRTRNKWSEEGIGWNEDEEQVV